MDTGLRPWRRSFAEFGSRAYNTGGYGPNGIEVSGLP
jgi:hypothetical protein